MEGSDKQALSRSRRRALDQLLTEYLEQAPAERAAYLERCRKRWPLLTRWLEKLVATNRGVTITVLGKPLQGVARQAIGQIEDCETNPIKRGHRLGPWGIVEKVGEGGLGAVYLGERADGAFEKSVAIKLLRLRGAGLGEQLQRECHLLARLDHPGISRLLDAGLDEYCGPFLVMEWIEGHDLSDWLAETPSQHCCLEVMCELCEAVDHAHRRMIVHGDIKPANVRVDREGRVKLLDFGIARLLGATEDDPGAIAALTPSFAPPEQHRGEPLDARSDVWALGALLSWMLRAGRVDSQSGEADPRSHPPEENPLQTISDAELLAAIDKACADEPGQRYASASDLLADLQRYRERRPLVAMPASRLYRMERFVRRNPLLSAAAIITMVLLTGGMSAISLLYFELQSAHQQVTFERDRAEQHTQELAEVVSFQETQLEGLDVLEMGASLHTSLFDMVNAEPSYQPLDGISQESAMDAFEHMLNQVNFTDLALVTMEETLFADTLEAIDRQFSNQPVLQARLLQTLATTKRKVGLIEQAREPQQRALDIRRERLGPAHRATLDSMLEMLFLNAALGEYEQGLEILYRRLELQLPTYGALDPDTLATINSIGSAYYFLGDLEKTERYYRRALDGRRAVLGEEHGDTAFTMTGLGAVQRDTGRLDEAETNLTEALDILDRVHGPAHHRTRNTMGQIARLMIEQNRLNDAKNQYETLLAIEQQTLGNRHPETLSTLHRMGQVLKLMGHYEAGAETLHELVAQRRELLGDHHPQTRQSIDLLARLYQRWDEAQPGAGHDESRSDWLAQLESISTEDAR